MYICIYLIKNLIMIPTLQKQETNRDWKLSPNKFVVFLSIYHGAVSPLMCWHHYHYLGTELSRVTPETEERERRRGRERPEQDLGSLEWAADHTLCCEENGEKLQIMIYSIILRPRSMKWVEADTLILKAKWDTWSKVAIVLRSSSSVEKTWIVEGGQHKSNEKTFNLFWLDCFQLGKHMHWIRRLLIVAQRRNIQIYS